MTETKTKTKNIVLIGFMGCGKTSVGMRLSKAMDRDFVETDAEIEKHLNKKIADIFAEHGEKYFREYETEICRIAGERENAVISTGGGVAKKAENIELLEKNGIIVYLRASPSHLYENLKNDNKRPLLLNTKDRERLETIERLLGERSARYEDSSHLTIDVSGKTIDEIVNHILNNLF